MPIETNGPEVPASVDAGNVSGTDLKDKLGECGITHHTRTERMGRYVHGPRVPQCQFWTRPVFSYVRTRNWALRSVTSVSKSSERRRALGEAIQIASESSTCSVRKDSPSWPNAPTSIDLTRYCKVYQDRRVVAPWTQVENFGSAHARNNVLRHKDIVHARSVQRAGTTLEVTLRGIGAASA